MKIRIFILFLSVLLFSFTLAYSKEQLIIISPHWEGVQTEITRTFQQWYLKNYGKEINLEWIDQGGTSDDLRFVESLFAKTPESVDIDLFFGGGMDPYIRLKEKGLLLKYEVNKEILEKIPPTCGGIPNYDKEFYWYGVVLSGFGILYNKKVLDYLKLPYPESWEDLGRSGYFSWVGTADPRHSGSMHMMYEIILQAYGWEKGWKTIFSLSGNTKYFSSSASQVAKDTSIGEVSSSLCIDSYALAQIQVNGEKNMGFILPKGATVINPDAIGILKGAPNLENAQRFIDFLLSYESQLIWMLPKGVKNGPVEFPLNRLSIRYDVYDYPEILFKTINPYQSKDTLPYDFELASKRLDLLNDIIGSCIIDSHGELKKAWNEVKDLPEENDLKQKFFKLPFEEDMQKSLWESWKDSAYRNEHISKWLNFSRDKFRDIKEKGRSQK